MKKLSLSKETLRSLDEDRLSLAVGGIPTSFCNWTLEFDTCLEDFKTVRCPHYLPND